MISSLASKCQDFEVGMSFFKPFYVMKLKTSKLKSVGNLKPVKISLPNSNHKVFISKESNIETLVGVATLPLSFLPSGKLPCRSKKRLVAMI